MSGPFRCPWAESSGDPAARAAYVTYHDQEWGRPLHGDTALFERLCLEAFQSGLSWLTILRKREGFRAAFAGFDPAVVADYGPDDVDRLLADPGIVRNRSKIEAAVGNARVVLTIPGGLSDLLWGFAPQAPRPAPQSLADVPSRSRESEAMATELKRLGLRFVGPTTLYALMQATGMVNDHLADCWVR